MRLLVFLQGLLFCATLTAQNLHIEKPGRGETLQDTQEFVIVATDGTPTRVDFYLNGRLILARREAPYVFNVRWNTQYKNTVKLVGHFDGLDPVVVSQDFEEIVVDVEEELKIFQFFPFIEQVPVDGSWTITSNGRAIKPQTFEPASKLPLNLIIALDTSGSMMFAFDDLEAPLRQLLAWCKEKNHPVRFLIFDRQPSLIKLENLPPTLKGLYRERGSSVVWDTIATAGELFPVGPRRVLLLISDGGDQGSRHSPASAEVYLRKSGAAMIWINTANLVNKDLSRLCDLSGGFAALAGERSPWPGIFHLLAGQYHVLAPDATWPVKLKVSKGRIWYPHWEK